MKNPFKGTDNENVDINDNEIKSDEEKVADENTEEEAKEEIGEENQDDVNPLQEKYDQLNNQYIRLAADFAL